MTMDTRIDRSVVVTHTCKGVDPEPAVGIVATEGVVHIEHIVESGADGLDLVMIFLVEVAAVDIEAQTIGVAKPLAKSTGKTQTAIVAPVAGV